MSSDDGAGGGERVEPAIEQGSYEIIRERLVGSARELSRRVETLNARRIETFGGTELAIVGNERIRTENNCIPRDIVAVGDRLLFGYNVFIGLRTETKVGDVFSVHRFGQSDTSFTFEQEQAEFLSDPAFVRDFDELYQYYRDTRLVQLRRIDAKLLAVFSTGPSDTDRKVFRWTVHVGGGVSYVDNRGERDNVFPPSHDFEWTVTTRADHVAGVHPHVSILDEVFVETIGGDLTIKVEDNTETGRGVYAEPVEDADQALQDADIRYARLGTLILLRIRPYREEAWRYLVYDTRAKTVHRIDAIGQACIQLPEDHGIIFPGGYFLQTGEMKAFEGDVRGMQFARAIRSPNGEDVLYVFNEQSSGRRILLPYNLIRKEVQNPIHCHGYSLFDDGKMVVFRASSSEPTRVHAMQVWQTPFTSAEHAAHAPGSGSHIENIGNADLVRGISDCLTIVRYVDAQRPTMATYEDLIAAVGRTLDAYFWLSHPDVGNLEEVLRELLATAELVIDEFEKVKQLQERADQVVAEAEESLRELVRTFRPDHWQSVDPFVTALNGLRAQRGHVITLRDVRYVDRERLDGLEADVVAQSEALSERVTGFLLGEEALLPYATRIADCEDRIRAIEKVTVADDMRGELEEIGGGLELLTEIVGGLSIEDATQRTHILEGISEVLGQLNRTRAVLLARRKELLSREGTAEFAAQFNLLAQGVSSGLAMAGTPEECDAQLARLMLHLEELEGRFSEFDEFLEQLATKREDVYEAFSSKKQVLLDDRQRRAERLLRAAERVLDNITRRSQSLKDQDQLNAYFASDPMVAKVREQAGRLRELGDTVKADEVESRLKAARDEAARTLRDRTEIYEEGAAVIRLGRHRFSVNEQPLDLTMVPRGDAMALHLTGTDYYEPIEDESFGETRPYWEQHLVSETRSVYRGEYLAACLLDGAEREEGGRTIQTLHEAAAEEGGLLDVVRRAAADRYDEGYERGLHDHDAVLLLEKLLALHSTAGLLRFSPRPRALAVLFWAFFEKEAVRGALQTRARSLLRLRRTFGRSSETDRFVAELARCLREYLSERGVETRPEEARIAGTYLFEELGKEDGRFVVSAEAVAVKEAFVKHLSESGQHHVFGEDLHALEGDLSAAWPLALAWVGGFVEESGAALANRAPAVPEAAALLLTEHRLDREVSSALGTAVVEGLLGQHPRIRERRMELRLDEFLERLDRFRQERAPGFREFQARRHALLERERQGLRLSEFVPRVMSSFVRNRLIAEVYLPIVGDNLAKQMGALGEGKRTDLMGMLLLISPPGYGKTTLMEYLANRLGLVFMKINGPALGHSVTSLDPGDAPNATARQELEKLNLSFEMGNNVLLYVDDIQHTNPEFLQKFISLCDAQRKVEGVFRGRTRTYDLRGKKFVVCMGGNPYTESGEKFQIPDMLANRADVYNLGDVLQGRDELFALSYVENALTSNPVLLPLAARDPKDVHRIVRSAQGDSAAENELSHSYSAVELAEIKAVLERLFRVRDVLLAVNAEYIRSASMDDAFRTEPRFQLQGSYRNMNKLAEKVVAIMNDEELEALIDDHYEQEAQTLTTGAEQNLLKLAEMRGRMTPEQEIRWDQIKQSFRRLQVAGQADQDDPVGRVTGQLGLLSERLGDIGQSIARAASAPAARRDEPAGPGPELADYLERLDATLGRLAEVAGAASSAHVLQPVLEKLEHGLAKALRAQPPPDAGAALGPYLEKLDATLSALASPRGEEGGLAAGLAPVLEALGDRLASASERAPAADEAAVAAFVEQLQTLAGHLASLRDTVERAARSAPPVERSAPTRPRGAEADVEAPILQRLDKTLDQLTRIHQGQERGRRLAGAVHDLLDRHVAEVEDRLLPVLHAMDKRLKASTSPADRKLRDEVDKILKGFDSVKELTEALQRGDGRRLTRAAGPGSGEPSPGDKSG